MTGGSPVVSDTKCNGNRGSKSYSPPACLVAGLEAPPLAQNVHKVSRQRCQIPSCVRI